MAYFSNGKCLKIDFFFYESNKQKMRIAAMFVDMILNCIIWLPSFDLLIFYFFSIKLLKTSENEFLFF